MKKSLLLLTGLYIAVSIAFSQGADSLSSPTTAGKLVQGIYFSYKELVTNSPSVTKPFALKPNYIVSKNKDSANGTLDSMQYGYTFKMLDTVLKKQKIFAAYDGKHLYIAFTEGSSLKPEQFLFPADYVGRFAPITFTLVAKRSFHPSHFGSTLLGVAVDLGQAALNTATMKTGKFEV